MTLIATLMVAHGHVEQTDTCASGMDDETCLIQTKVAMKKHQKPVQAYEWLAELEEVASADGQDTLKELVHGVMALPVLKSEKAIREAAQQSELHNFANRHPHLKQILTKFEDPQVLEQIKTAAYHGEPSFLKLMRQERRTKSNVTSGWSALQTFAKKRKEQRVSRSPPMLPAAWHTCSFGQKDGGVTHSYWLLTLKMGMSHWWSSQSSAKSAKAILIFVIAV